MKDRSLYDMGVEVDGTKPVMTLSTCNTVGAAQGKAVVMHAVQGERLDSEKRLRHILSPDRSRPRAAYRANKAVALAFLVPAGLFGLAAKGPGGTAERTGRTAAGSLLSVRWPYREKFPQKNRTEMKKGKPARS